ncbi:hypothetical protein [Goodfellowiella coeruleoviolacea]|uniref:ATP-grasp domain-containing protein n=1 Tax=Goodfellowiella coeruleoviolacea TaxID=334858 RepID=A0AAE3G7I6_9PSEU|nr:hypothetical protein [Goodfellowiella coeruleoviolacea]MCP2163166.1 hypothetical protein [Goodfellowiella coeruleoviolacea]
MTLGAAVRLGTFDAERHWRPQDLARLPSVSDPAADLVVAAMDELLAVTCAPGDLLVTGSPVPPLFLDVLGAAGATAEHRTAPGDPAEPVEQRLTRAPLPELAGRTLVPYAVLPDTAAMARRCALRVTSGDVDVVREVSSKTWSNTLVQRAGLPGAGEVVRSTRALEDAVRAQDGRPVLVKDPHGVSGRGTVEVSSPRVLSSLVRSLSRQVDRGARLELLVQPRFDRVLDFSAHAEVRADGQVVQHGVLLLENTAFSYAGSRPAPPDLVARLADRGYHHQIALVGTALAEAGYRGPLCVDSMLLRDGTLVPVLEINPRLSMGSIALAAARLNQECAVRLAVRRLRVPAAPAGTPAPTRAFEAVVAGLRGHRALLRAGGTGVLPLAVNTLRPPWGRFYCAVVASDAEEDRRWDAVLDSVLDGVLDGVAPVADQNRDEVLRVP